MTMVVINSRATLLISKRLAPSGVPGAEVTRKAPMTKIYLFLGLADHPRNMLALPILVDSTAWLLFPGLTMRVGCSACIGVTIPLLLCFKA